MILHAARIGQLPLDDPYHTTILLEPPCIVQCFLASLYCHIKPRFSALFPATHTTNTTTHTQHHRASSSHQSNHGQWNAIYRQGSGISCRCQPTRSHLSTCSNDAAASRSVTHRPPTRPLERPTKPTRSRLARCIYSTPLQTNYRASKR